jgi:hypothetical protein
MFCDHPPDEKGPVVRQKFEFASLVSNRRGWASLLAIFALSSLALAPVLAQENKEAELEADASRKAANISWNPKLSFDEWKALDKIKFIEFDRKLGTAALTDADRKLLLKHLQNQIDGLTLEQNVDRHAIIIDGITRAAEHPSTAPAVRDLILENSLKLVEPLLKDQPPNVQYSLVLLAARLNSKPANLTARPQVPPQPYAESRKLLMKVLTEEPPKPISARIIAARGLERLMRDGDLSTVNKADIGQVLADALKQKVENPLARKWYRWKLVDALGATGRYEDVGYRPVIIDALMTVLTNREDDWEVRTAAARAVSQLPLDQKINVDLVNYAIVQLLYDLAKAYNASDKMPPSTWRWSFDNIYLAYKSKSLDEQNNKHWGLMHLQSPAGREQITSAYKVVLAAVKPILEQQTLPPVPDAAIKTLGEWLEKNKPAQDKRQVTPQSPQLQLDVPVKPAQAVGNPPGQGGQPGGQ